MELKDALKAGYIGDLKRLYDEAFPDDEKKPFDYMLKLTDAGKMEMLAVEEEGRFAGLIINLLCSDDVALLDYFAVDPSMRSFGIGGRALKLLLEKFSDKKLIFEIERPDNALPDTDMKARRKRFYLRNGVKETGVFANVYNTDFELLTNDGKLKYDEYVMALRDAMGDRVDELLKPRELF